MPSMTGPHRCVCGRPGRHLRAVGPLYYLLVFAWLYGLQNAITAYLGVVPDDVSLGQGVLLAADEALAFEDGLKVVHALAYRTPGAAFSVTVHDHCSQAGGSIVAQARQTGGNP